MKEKNDSRQQKTTSGNSSRLSAILFAAAIFIAVYSLLEMYQSANTNGSGRANSVQPVATTQPVARATRRPYTAPTRMPTAEPQNCGTNSSPVLQCRYTDGMTIRAASMGQHSSRVRITVRCGSKPCRFSYRDFELYSGATGEYPDWSRSNLPDLIAPHNTTTVTLKYRRFIGNDSVLRFHALGYVDAWLRLR